MQYPYDPSTLRNPYNGGQAWYTPPQEPRIEPASGHPTKHNTTWLWSGTGFSRELTPDETHVLSAFLRPCFADHYPHAHPATPIALSILSVANAPFARALTHAARQTPVRPDTTHPRREGDQHCPFRYARLWLSVWPWVSPDLRAALRPHLTHTISFVSALAFRLLDPEFPLPPGRICTSEHEARAARIISRHAHPTALLTHLQGADWRRPSVMDETILRWATAQELEALFDDPRMDQALPYVFFCYHASSTLVARACRANPTRYQDGRHHQPIRLPWPFWAEVDPVASLLNEDAPQDSLLRLVPWTGYLPSVFPRLRRPTDLDAFERVLRHEWDGPYADLAHTLWGWGLPGNQPPTRPNQSGTGPWKIQVDHALTDPTTAESILAFIASSPMVSRDHPLIATLIRHPNFTQGLAARLSLHASPRVRRTVAGHPLLSQTDRTRLEQDASRQVQARAIPTQPLANLDLQALEQHYSPTLRAGLATHPALPLDLLTRLSQDPSSLVRKALAAHPALPQPLLLQLSRDRFAVVREAIAQRADCPAEVLANLIYGASPGIRLALAAHPATPAPVLHRLAQRANRPLAERLVRHPGLADADRIHLSLK